MDFKVNKKIFLLFSIFLLALFIRIWNIYPANTIIGFDQARDLFDARSIFQDWDLKIIGPTAGNNANLHHGVLYLYYILIPQVIFGGNPFWIAAWNSLFNGASVFIIYFLSRAIFKDTRAALISAIIVGVSYYFIQFSGWLSNPTITLFTVPIFFLGLWQYIQGKKYGLPLTALGLGLSIEFELFFIYLIPIGLIILLLFKRSFPSIQEAALSTVIFALTTLTMILTEIKFHFSGVLSLLGAGQFVGDPKTPITETLPLFLDRFWKVFSLNLTPQNPEYGFAIGVAIFTFVVFKLIDKTTTRQIKGGLLFTLIYLVSPAIMLLLGYHNAPWFLIGMPPAVALISGYVISKLKPTFVIYPVVILIVFLNIKSLVPQNTQKLLEPDPSSILSTQIKAIDYTYQQSKGEPFMINSLTNPLYINAIWGYHYSWYGKNKYGYLPSFGGGDQLHPYDTLPKTDGKEKYLFLIIDTTPRIPLSHKLSLVQWANEISKFESEKDFEGILVQKRIIDY